MALVQCNQNEDKNEDKHVEYHVGTSIPNLMSEYRDGAKNGLWTITYPNGEIHIQCNYNCNVLNGEYVEYSKNNTILKKGMFFNGVKIGLWVENFEVGCYDENGQRIGTWIRKRQNLTIKSEYEKGVIKTTIRTVPDYVY